MTGGVGGVDPKDARKAFALLKIRAAQISKALKTVEPYLDQEPGDKNTAKLGRARLGSVQKTDPQTRAIVSDAVLLLKWVKENRPDQIDEVVNATFQVALLKDMTDKQALVDVNGEEVPGLMFGAEAPAQRFYPAEDAATLLDVLDPEDLPAIDGIDLPQLLGLRARGGEPGE